MARVLFSICLIALGVLTGTGTPAHAEPAHCEDLYSAVCGSDGSASVTRARRIEKNINEAQSRLRATIERIAREDGLPTPDPSDLFNSALKSVVTHYPYQFEKARDAAVAIFAALESALLDNAGIGDLDQIKREMALIVETTPGLSPAFQQDMVKRVSQTRLMLTSEYLRTIASTTDELWPITGRVSYDGAWNQSTGEGDERVVVIFPGLLAAQTRDLNFIFAHELSHSMDFDTLPNAYGELTACMSASNGKAFDEWTEISADFWGVELLAHELTTAHASPEQTLDVLKRSHEILCEAQSEDRAFSSLISRFAHPSGEFRIQQILGGNPKIRSLLGCSAKPACGIAGAVHS